MRPSLFATLALAAIAALSPAARADDGPAPTPPAPAPAAPEKPAGTPPKTTRHYFLERYDRGGDPQHKETPPPRVELTRAQAVEHVARVVWELNERRDKAGKLELSDEELAAAIQRYDDMGGETAMTRVPQRWAMRIIVEDTADATP